MDKETKRNVLTFQYDADERIGSDSYLTPVYFNKQVLIRYFYDSRFYCDFTSETYGTISSEDFMIQFGINSNGSVIMWLGDIKERLPQREQFYLLVENKEPEDNIQSEFYEAQINAKFTELPISIKCLNEITKLNSSFHERYGIFLYKEQSIEERIEVTRRYKQIILNSEDDFKRFISELNEIITENTNNRVIRQFLNSKGIDVTDQEGKKLKGNKLLEKVYSEILLDKDNNIAPFFYLYDLRLWSDHSLNIETYANAVKNLGLPDNATFEDVLNALFLKMHESCLNLQKKLTA